MTAEDMDLLNRVFALAGKADGSGRRRPELVRIIERRIRELTQPGSVAAKRKGRGIWRWQAFGAKTPKELAELGVAEIERMNVRYESVADFLNPGRIEGYRSRIRGKLFHLLVRNFEPLQADFRQDAALQLEELNDPQLAKSFAPTHRVVPDWINAKGAVIPRLQRFGRPRRAENIRIVKTTGRIVEFVDDMFVSYADGVLGRLWTFLNEVEVKTSGAACGFARQIGFAQLRLGAPELKFVEMEVEGFKRRVRVPAERIIFSQRSIGRNAITLFNRKAWARLSDDARARLAEAMDTGDVAEIYKRSDFRIQSTTQQTIDSVFLRITLAIQHEFLDALVQAIWPSLGVSTVQIGGIGMVK